MNLRAKLVFSIGLLGFCIGFTPMAKADNILTVTGTPGGMLVDSSQYGATSWMQTGSYTGIEVDAVLGANDASDTGTAYLMNQIGPGTTVANEVAAPVNFSLSNSTPALTSLFTGVTLGPGTYYLVIASNEDLIWGLTASPTDTTGPGDSVNESEDAFVLDPFAPASSFSTFSTDQLVWDVSGTPTTTVTNTPEPSSMFLLGTGLLAVVAMGWRRNSQAGGSLVS